MTDRARTPDDSWQPIDSAPSNTLIQAGHGRRGEWTSYHTQWASPIRRPDGYIVNKGKLWWLDSTRQWLKPTPTHWKPE